jgi:hypothetical protein
MCCGFKLFPFSHFSVADKNFLPNIDIGMGFGKEFEDIEARSCIINKFFNSEYAAAAVKPN